jgi:hypothetical protein
MPVEGIVGADFSQTDWFADELPLPAEIELGQRAAAERSLSLGEGAV